MEPSWLSSPAPVLLLTLHLLVFLFHGGSGYECGETVWPGILSNAGTPQLESTGFELPVTSSRSFQAPSGWSGRFWARTGCSSTGGSWSCATGECGSGQVECNGAGAAPPATLAEFTLAPSSAGQDFYDVSLVDGYNLPMVVEASGRAGASGECAATGCVVDLNRMCPVELRAAQGEACRSACEAFGTPEYCCSGAFASPATCRPSSYSQMFKAACPRSYSYAFDDPTSTFTCAGEADYTITFCPRSAPSHYRREAQGLETMTTPFTEMFADNLPSHGVHKLRLHERFNVHGNVKLLSQWAKLKLPLIPFPSFW
ncbi:hypothetical protein GW17_00019868 [Ensete ventricosum]|nr:hypothetical protein GW17_00019868 [Ensete ventricosum]